MRRYFEFVVQHAYLTILVIAAATLFFALQLKNLTTELDPERILPQEHPYVRLNNRIEALFGGSRVIILGIRATDGEIFTPSHLGQVIRITERVKTIPGVVANNVLSISDRKVKHLTFNPEGFTVQPVIDGIPRTQAEADAVKRRVLSNPLYIGALVSRDASSAAVIIDITDKIEGPHGAAPVSDRAIYEEVKRIAEAQKDNRTEIHLGGLPVALAYLEKDTAVMNFLVFPIAFLVVMLVHYYSFRTLQGMLIPPVTALLSVIWALGSIALLGMPLDLWTKGLTPILIVAMAAGHSVQILRRFYEELDYLVGTDVPDPVQKVAVIQATSKMAPVVLTAGGIAAASFASLATFRLGTFQSFGLMTAFGIGSALILEMTFIPAIRSLIRPPSGEDLARILKKGPADRLLSLSARWALSPAQPWVLAAGTGLALVSLIFASRIQLNNSLRDLFFERTELRRDDKILNEKFGGTSTFNILIGAPRADGLKDPGLMRGIEGLQQSLSEDRVVGRTESFVDTLKRIRRAFYEDDPKAERIPESREEAAQFLFLYSISGNPEDFRRLVDSDYRQALILGFLKSDATEQAQRVITAAQGYVKSRLDPSVSIGFGGSAPVTLALNEVVVRGKTLNIAQIVLITYLLTSAVFRSFIAGFFVIVPLGVALLVNFGFMGLVGFPLGVSTAAISAMAVGMGADYAVYILFRMREGLSMNRDVARVTQAALGTAGKAVLWVATAFAAGTALVTFPGYYFHLEGILMPLAMMTSALAAVILLPSMLLAFRPAFLFSTMPPEAFDSFVWWRKGRSKSFNPEGQILDLSEKKKKET